MDFSPDPTMDDIAEGVRHVCSQFDDEYWLGCEQDHRFPWEFYEAMATGGWLGVSLPEEYGGGGLGTTAAATALQAVAASGAGLNGCGSIHLGIFGLEPLIRYGSAELKERILPRMARGDLHVSFGVTEPDAGTDTTSITTFARKVDGGYEVHGKKTWISKAQVAERVLLLARTTPKEDVERRTDGLSLFVAPIDRETMDIRAIPKMGRNAVDSNEIFIDGLFIPEEDRIGEEGKGFTYLLAGLNAERILVAYEAIGLGRCALDRAVEYAKTRIVFDRPIGQNQAVQFRLAECLAELDAAQLVAAQAAWLDDRGLPCGREANVAKLLASEAAFKATDAAMTTMGGFGYSKEYHVERFFREARLLRLAPVSQDLILHYLGTKVLGMPRSF